MKCHMLCLKDQSCCIKIDSTNFLSGIVNIKLKYNVNKKWKRTKKINLKISDINETENNIAHIPQAFSK